jgi:hypothetical protein
MTKRWLLILGPAVVLLLVGLVCSSSEKKQSSPLDDPAYAGWKIFKWEKVEIIYPPNHPQESVFQSVAAGYIRARDQVSAALDMPVPQDTIRVIYYSGYRQGQEMTGQPYPFAKDGIIHFWLPSFFGVTFMQWMIPKWVPQEPQFPFLKHGLMALFDYSGQDYHGATIGYQVKGRFVPLDSLVVDTAVNSDTERLQSGEAASFDAFVLSTYGAKMFKRLYTTSLPFDQFVRDSLGTTVDGLQEKWLEYAQANISEEAQRVVDSLRQTIK